jgi:hypothetical protein
MGTRGGPSCGRCVRPVGAGDTAYVCGCCAGELARKLVEAGDLVDEAEVTAARLARYGTGGRPGAEQQLPYHWSATDAVWVAGNVLTTWARHVAETRGNAPGRPGPMLGPLCRAGLSCRHLSCQTIRSRARPHPVARAARWLATQTGWLRHRPEAVEAVDELLDACALLRRTADRPPQLWYAGPCEPEPAPQCRGELYALPGASAVRCRDCGMRHDAGERRAWLLQAARGTLAHATLLATALTALGLDVTPSMVRNYADRGRILAHGADDRGRPLYLVGEVIDILGELAARRAGDAA